MKILSVDLPWKEATGGRRAVAVADLAGTVRVHGVCDDAELRRLLHDHGDPESLVLLDIPIEGCDTPGRRYFRDIDRALAKQGIPLLPVPRTESTASAPRGRALKEALERTSAGARVLESYPYAVYKYLAYLKTNGSLGRLHGGIPEALLDHRFRSWWPPKYKRERNRKSRLENMQYLHALLTDTALGLSFPAPLAYPASSDSPKVLEDLCDQYDACLGAVAGLLFARRNAYAVITGQPGTGTILLLADLWLRHEITTGLAQVQPSR